MSVIPAEAGIHMGPRVGGDDIVNGIRSVPLSGIPSSPRKRGPKSARLIREIAPIVVRFLDQVDLPCAIPFLHPLLALNSFHHPVMKFEIDQSLDPVLLGESTDSA